MQIKVHDVKNEKKEISAEIGMLQKRLFYCRNCEIRLRSILFLRQGYLRMSEQRDLPESMAWRVIGRLESGQTQRSVADTVGVARSVVARMWNRFKETGNVRRRPGAGRPRATTSSYDRYIQLTYGGTGALEITPHSFVKYHNTEELVGWYGVESALADVRTCISFGIVL
ncbi:uncharacterized protein TNCV_1662591 [Trichonephila clavipes]|nr:uncharacterized protein TNCV_1662591 [Trichonephila clavipes]